MGSSQSTNKHYHEPRFTKVNPMHYKVKNTKELQLEMENEKKFKLKCNKENFRELVDIISDAHEVSEFYAELLLQNTLPVALLEYRNYTKLSEMYFNHTRKVKKRDIDMSYADFYNQLAFLNYTYEAPVNNGAIRRNILLDVFEKSNKIQKYLLEDLYRYCGNTFQV